MACLHSRDKARLKLFFRSANGNSVSTSDKKTESAGIWDEIQNSILERKNIGTRIHSKNIGISESFQNSKKFARKSLFYLQVEKQVINAVNCYASYSGISAAAWARVAAFLRALNAS
jgi:hypothetical protein